jgi:hypothetical protein
MVGCWKNSRERRGGYRRTSGIHLGQPQGVLEPDTVRLIVAGECRLFHRDRRNLLRPLGGIIGVLVRDWEIINSKKMYVHHFNSMYHLALVC